MELESIRKAGEDENNVLDYVKTFKSLAHLLKENLNKVVHSKQDQANGNSKSELSSVIEESFTGLMNLRINHRNLYLEIEKSRLQTQREKEKIDNVASELEELTYLRDSIISEINGSRNRNFPNISKLETLNTRLRENDANLKPENIKERHRELLDEFNQELEKRKKVKYEFEAKEEEKNGLIKKCEEDKNFLTKIPQHVQKISDVCKPLQHLYKTGVSINYDQIQISKTLPTPFYWLYKKLVTLKESKLDESVEIELKENAEVAERLGFYKVQIVFSIMKDRVDPSLKKYNEILNEKAFFSGAFPLKFFFSFLPSHDLVLVNLESKNFFTVDEILSKIVEDDSGSKLFSDPKTDVEKNINMKYSVYSWIQELCKEGKSVNFTDSDHNEGESPPKIASLVELVKAIRKRVTNRLLLKYQIESFRNNKQIPVGILKLFEMNEFPKLDLEIITCNKISKEDYLRWIEPSSFLKKGSDTTEELFGSRSLGDKISDFLTKKGAKSNVQTYGYQAGTLAYKKQTHVDYSQHNQDSKEDFYRIEFLHQKYKVTGYVLVDYNYPISEPKIVFRITTENPKEPVIPEEIRKRFSKKALEQLRADKGKAEQRIDHIVYDTIERTVNQKTTLPDQTFIFTYKVLMFMITLQKHLK